ncbi:MAG: formylglycine-generating enzyme family protein [Methylotenera sp.]|uniref:formylglycine-generating enzyme family protein n=1 Tax=Methylotenera sp. TaxID=2051956 RepID=UPI002489BD69|nr:formylglycine-generating enzyme family protein [Methylotenera sp.]MDI1310188.1 formylglycine-generating enzyme family protein [Methylotenera sp.]
MLLYYFALMMFISPSTWGQDSIANNGMANITAGEYRPLYLSLDSPLVSVAPFKLDKQAVTNREYQNFVSQNTKWQRAISHSLFVEDAYLSHWEKGANQFRPNSADLEKPVIFVSWYAAQAYCQAQQKRLPTVAEWEYVAQASFTQKDGSQEKDYNQKVLDWYAKAAKHTLTEVGKDEPNYWGVHNMHGLIWEWTEDFNSDLISGESRDDSSVNKDLYCASGSAGAVNPSDYAAFMRYGFRSSLNAKFTLGSLGFRCAMDGDQ